jgi:hypothetical protein
MKKSFLIFFSCLIVVILFSCSGNNADNSGENANSDTVADASENGIDKDRLLPEMVEVGKPVEVAKLYKAFYEWTGKEILIAGYAKMYGESEKLVNDIQLRESTDIYDVLFTCNFKSDLNKEVKADDVLIIKGKIKENSYWGIVLTDCELVSINGKYNKDITLAPGQKQTEAIWIADFYKAYNSWLGKVVTVIGHYNSTTTSTTSYGTTYRIDLDDSESGQKMVGCTMVSEPDSDKLAKNRDNVKIRGKIARDLWGTVQLEECVIVE